MPFPILNLESRRTDYHNAVLAQIHDLARQAGLLAQREPRGLLFSTGLTAAGRARLASERDAAVMLGDARDATASDGAGVNRAALVPFSNVERRVNDVDPSLGAKDPAGHSSHELCPAPLIVPASQSACDDSPSLAT